MRYLLSIGVLSVAMPLMLLGGSGCQKKAPPPGGFIKGKEGETLQNPQTLANPQPGDGTAQAEPPKEKEAPKPSEVKGKGKGLIQSIRGAAMRPQSSNELKQIGLYFRMYLDDFKKKPATEEEFVRYIGIQGGPLGKLMADKHYVYNPKVNPKDLNAVVAWEAVNDGGRFMAVRVDGNPGPIPEAELEVLLELRKP